MNQTVGIIGCGWLGLPLAEALVKKGFCVKGSTTSLDKLPELTERGITAYFLRLTDIGIEGDWQQFFSNIEQLIINIPPKLRKNPEESYLNKLALLLNYFEQKKSLKIILVSSTSVYGDHQYTVSEQSFPEPDTDSGKELVKAEQLIQSSGHPFTIVRFGGLIGLNRHPVNYLSGRKNNERPLAPINLIHRTDCIAVLEECIQRETFQGILNAVSPYHPSRKTYYSETATKMDLPAPEFDENDTRLGKQIHPKLLLEDWNYTFQIKP